MVPLPLSLSVRPRQIPIDVTIIAMRFFTCAWHAGELPDAEFEAVPETYRRHLESLAAGLPGGVKALAEELNLHDARVRRITLDADLREVRLELRCGDRVAGYEDVVVTYVDTAITPDALTALRDATNDPTAEILYDEVDVTARRRFSHRLLFWPYRETELTFHDVAIDRARVASRDFAAVEPRWIEI